MTEKSTLVIEERRAIYERIDYIIYNVGNLTGIVRNPLSLTHKDISDWSSGVKMIWNSSNRT